jgi:hypothetical protein
MLLSSVKKGDIGIATGATRYRRVVTAVPVSEAVGDLFRPSTMDHSGPWMVFHLLPSPFYDHEIGEERGREYAVTENQRVFLMTRRDMETKFRRVGNSNKYVDQRFFAYIQQMNEHFEAVVKGNRTISTPGRPGDWLVQLYEPGQSSLMHHTAMQFVIKEEGAISANFSKHNNQNPKL